MIEETYAVFAAWDFDRVEAREPRPAPRRELHRRQQRDVAPRRRQGPEPPLRARRARPRRWSSLRKHGLALDEWKPLLLWHMTRDEFLVRDFLRDWLFAAYDSGAFRIRTEDVEAYLAEYRQARGGTTEHAWSEQTTQARRGRPAEDRRRLRPAARHRRQGVRLLPPARAQLPLPAARDARREAEPRARSSRRPTGACS